jgi:hypothetical protein
VTPGPLLLIFCSIGVLLFAAVGVSAPLHLWQVNSWQLTAIVTCGVAVGVKLWRFGRLGTLTPVGKALRERAIKSTPSRPGYFWGGESLTFEEACKHFVTVGCTGSGKSITLNLLLQSVLSKMRSGDGVRRRAIVYDAK